MHELPYEPATSGLGVARRLARWLAAWTLVVFGLMGVGSLVSVASTSLALDSKVVLTEITEGGAALGYVISGLAVPLAIAGLVVWLVSGRVMVLLLASVPVAIGTGQVFYYVRFIVDWGLDWTMLAWMAADAGFVLLGLFFLTRTYRVAVNAPPAS